MLEKEMATHSSILAWRIPWTEEPGGLHFMGSQRVGHDWASEHSIYVSILLSQFVAPSPFPAGSKVCSLCLHLYFCPAKSSSVPSFCIPYICVNIQCLFSSFWLTSLCVIGSTFNHHIRTLELTQMCSFLWPTYIPLYICTTTSLCIHLLVDI